jgi:hypothetical protein
MKLSTFVLAAAMSLPLWANEPAAPVAPAAPAEPAAPAAPAVAQPAPVAVPAPTANTAVALPPEVKEEIILNNPANLQALKTLLGPELTQAGAAQASPQAAQQQANGRAGAASRVATQSPAQTAAMTAGRQQVQVRPGETLDRILARALGATPFAPALVRKTVVDMNPTAFAGGSPHRLNAGATLVLPSMQDLQAVAGGGSTGAALLHSPAGGGHAQSQDDRRHWIRYP